MSGHGGAREGSGRKKGGHNADTTKLLEKLAELECDPVEGMAKIALGLVDCDACDAEGLVSIVQFYELIGRALPAQHIELSPAQLTERSLTCPICTGTKTERVPLSLKSGMYKELVQYVAPKRKAVEHSGLDGDPIEHNWTVEFMNATSPSEQGAGTPPDDTKTD